MEYIKRQTPLLERVNIYRASNSARDSIGHISHVFAWPRSHDAKRLEISGVADIHFD